MIVTFASLGAPVQRRLCVVFPTAGADALCLASKESVQRYRSVTAAST